MLPKKLIYKLFLVLAIPLLLAWSITSISQNQNLKFFEVAGFLILIVFGIYAALIIFFKFGRSINIVFRERNIAKKILTLGVFFLLLIAVIIGIDKFFETAFKFGGF
ncbi:MAG: hypothetical protein PHY72_04445 [Candidatus Pacebacteria bacterium]|nr:hypothetical protein [Candidatus Paceibacterota bacterium]